MLLFFLISRSKLEYHKHAQGVSRIGAAGICLLPSAPTLTLCQVPSYLFNEVTGPYRIFPKSPLLNGVVSEKLVLDLMMTADNSFHFINFFSRKHLGNTIFVCFFI